MMKSSIYFEQCCVKFKIFAELVKLKKIFFFLRIFLKIMPQSQGKNQFLKYMFNIYGFWTLKFFLKIHVLYHDLFRSLLNLYLENTSKIIFNRFSTIAIV